ncbi:hypothetical protein OY671_012668, partial [Metschnikowia pulcherrima]
RWSSSISRISRGAERGGRQWTTARKKDSLKRVSDGSKSSATRSHQRSTQLVGSWDSDTSDNSSSEGDEATADTPAASTDDNAAAAPAQASTATTAALSATTLVTTVTTPAPTSAWPESARHAIDQSANTVGAASPPQQPQSEEAIRT